MSFSWVSVKPRSKLSNADLYAQYMKPEDNLIIMVLVAGGGTCSESFRQ